MAAAADDCDDVNGDSVLDVIAVGRSATNFMFGFGRGAGRGAGVSLTADESSKQTNGAFLLF